MRGLYVPNGAVAGDVDATSISTNPGQLGLVEMTSTALLADFWDNDVPHEGRGLGGFLTSPLIVRSLTIGAGFEWMSRPTVAQVGDDGYGKLSLGGGLRLGRGLGVGVIWEHLFGGPFGGLDGMSTGFGWQPASYVAVGLAVRDVLRPRPVTGGPRVPREWDGEIAIRPTGTPRLELAGGVRLLDGGR